ncbi:phospho-N-acetylmuramoyl-pentapeptide-transferase [Gammaproteobacteria bacterium]|nr:phospho-N-acetylmuramoyl-pentapeptide-transferase [Gammaproteobacteria bacterium]
MTALMISLLCFYYGLPQLRTLIQPYREDGAQHQHKIGTPTMGGVLILLAVCIRCMPDIFSPYGFCLLGFFLLGLLDDYAKVKAQSSAGVSPRYKLLMQILLSVVTLSMLEIDTQIDVFGCHFELGGLYYPFAVFLMVASSNALNLTDGLDGLAASQAIIILFYFSIYSILGSSQMLFIQAVTLALMVFLLYNWHPAKVFMGDAGSLSIGAFIGLMAIDLKLEIYFILPAIVMIVEVLSVIIQVVGFKRGYGRIFKMAPIHHHFELSGYKEVTIVLSSCLVTFLLSGLAVWLN